MAPRLRCRRGFGGMWGGSRRKGQAVPIGSIKLRHANAHRAFTMLELMVSVTIIIVLAGIVVFGSRSLRESRRRAMATQQMATIASAIDRYASFWPRWQAVFGTSELVIADRGWPDPVAGRLFDPSVFETVTGFNDHLSYDNTNVTAAPPGDAINANSCLVACLTGQIGQGPFLTDKEGLTLVAANEFAFQATPQMYPPYLGLSGSGPRLILVDPWGTPYRYFWAFRDTSAGSIPAYRGFLPVSTADVTSPSFRKADTFVLESAGRDKLFGNVWKSSPTVDEVDRAFDNLIITP